MIYLIGGPPKCGKTTLAKKISKQFGIPWVSSDALQGIVRKYLSKHLTKKDFDKLFPHTASKGKTNDETYAKSSTVEIVKNYTQQARATYNAIVAFCESELADGNDYIVEGYHVTPELVSKLKKEYGSNKFSAVFLVKENPTQLLKDIHKSSTPNDWIIARTEKQETFERIVEMICLYGKYFVKEAKKYRLPVVVMDNSFATRLREVERQLGL